MKRLTVSYKDDPTGRQYSWALCHERLYVIEDILGDDYDLDRLKEIVEADKENRCIILKFGIGSTVYRLWVYPDGTKPFITENKINNIQDLINAESWTDVYKTKEEAEAALRRMQNEGVH